ncbi:amyloid beta binding 1 [Fusarium agapanthi]|uniref:Amyloid beta binding 1 n=1 Tax=Fusarium agapanthi TaxID=1803897 RepID=A0A9P5E2Z4_9HYPO|nr:amyloid beta binding 1 [Fusarium agapanthi]
MVGHYSATGNDYSTPSSPTPLESFINIVYTTTSSLSHLIGGLATLVYPKSVCSLFDSLQSKLRGATSHHYLDSHSHVQVQVHSRSSAADLNMADVMIKTPPVLQGPSEKERKYDRQLRLWAASGQAALESANILLVNSGAGTVGVETLKNLVLPGIGRFTIADQNAVTHQDLGVNFFVDDSWLGKSRAEACTNFLLELNPEVQGEWYPKTQDESFHLDRFLSRSPTFTMILYALPLPQDQVQLIRDYSHQHKTPTIAVHSVGYYSYFKTTLPGTFPIVDTHPDETATTDLRLLAPWPELLEFSQSMTENIDNLDSHEHGHLPMVVILLHYLEQWKQAHGGAYPTSYVDKTTFRKTVSEAMRTDNPEGGEENFEEAIAAVMKHVVKPSLPSSLRQVFDHVHQDPVRTSAINLVLIANLCQEEITSGFWVTTEAVKRFYNEHGRLPVPGGLPDMKAQSNVYIKLQNIYKERARQDVGQVLETARSLPGGQDVDPEQVELFCKNASFIKLINAPGDTTTSLDKLVEQELANDEISAFAGPEMPLSLVPLYLALLATSNTKTASADEIMGFIGKAAQKATENERYKKTAQEVERAAGGELHNISALTGGMVAQEMIKMITKQYVPIDNTCIFDGIDSRCQVLRL